jgi:hypothetical protein
MVLAAAFWTQSGLALWLAALVLTYIVVLSHGSGAESRKRASVTGLAGWAGGVLLGGLGLLPLILERGMGGGIPIVFADHFVYPYQLLLAGWGMGPSIPGPYDTLTFDLGVVAFGLAALSVLPLADRTAESPASYRPSNANSRLANRGAQYVAVAILLTVVFLSTTMAAGAWRLLPGLTRSLSYPWQLLLLGAPWLAWLAGSGGRALAEFCSRKLTSTSGSDRTDQPQRGELGGELKALSLFGGLIALVVLNSYAYLNPPTIASPISGLPVAIFGNNEIALLDAEVSGMPGPGGRSVVSARWQALRPLDNDYTIFVHALTPDGTRWAQADAMPQGGKLPTSQWRPGQVVTDRYTLTFKPDAPATQDYRYLVGLYLWQTGQRLSAGADDKVALAP